MKKRANFRVVSAAADEMGMRLEAPTYHAYVNGVMWYKVPLTDCLVCCGILARTTHTFELCF